MPEVKALIVDDSKVARISLLRMLREFDVDADMAASGREAIDYLKSGSQLPDIVFMDHTMPEMDGFEVVRHIKGDPGISGVPVVMCTANEGEQYEKQAAGVGAFGILSKPPIPERLQELLNELESVQPVTVPEAAPVVEQEITMEQITTIAKSAAEESAREAVESRLEEILDARIEATLEKLLERRVGSAISAQIGGVEARLSDLASSMVSGETDQIRSEISSINQRLASELRSKLENHVESLLGERVESLHQKIIEEAKQGSESLLAVKMDELQRLLGEQTPVSGESAAIDQQALREEIETGLISRVESLVDERTEAIENRSAEEAKTGAENAARGLLDAELGERVETMLAEHVGVIQQAAVAEAKSGTEAFVEKRLGEMRKHFDDEAAREKESRTAEFVALRELIATELEGRVESALDERLDSAQQKAVEEARAGGETAFTEQLTGFRKVFEKQAPEVLEKLIPEASTVIHFEKKIKQLRLLAIGAGVVGVLAALVVYLAS